MTLKEVNTIVRYEDRLRQTISKYYDIIDEYDASESGSYTVFVCRNPDSDEMIKFTWKTTGLYDENDNQVGYAIEDIDDALKLYCIFNESNGYSIDEGISTPVIMGVKSHCNGRTNDLGSNQAMDAIDNFRKQVHQYIGYRALERIKNAGANNSSWCKSEKSIINALKPFEESFEKFIEIAKSNPKYFAGILGLDGCYSHYRLEDIVDKLKKIKNHPEIFTKQPSFLQKAKFKLLGKEIKESIKYLQEHDYIITEEPI